MEDGSSKGGGFARTRDSDLHQAIREDNFVLPKGLDARSTVRIVLSAVQPFMYIAAAIVAVSGSLPLPVGVLLAFLLIVAAQRSFLTLVHDASHKLYSKDREWNDLLADYLAAGFIGLFLRKYRKIHLAHHSANGSADDPEYFGIEVVERAGGWSRFVLRYALGLEIPYLLGKYHVNQDGYLGDRRVHSKAVDNPRRFEKLSVVVAQAGLLVTFWSFGVWPLYLMWLYAAVSWSPMFSRLRFLAEHPGRGKLTLSTEGTWWERIYFAPHHFNFHLEHHLWPSVPPYRLPRTHAELLRSGFFERHSEYLAASYVETLAKYEIRS